MNNDKVVTQDEKELIQKAKNNDREAFGLLYDRYISPIYRFIFLRVSERAEAEDISHQVFLNAWQNIEGYDFRGFPFSSWLYRIAANLVVDYYRSHHRQTVDIEEIDESWFAVSENLGDAADRASDLAQIKQAIARLEPDQQNVLVMKFVNELSNKEIAEILEKKEGAVRVIQHRAIKNLKKYVEES